MGNGGGGGNKIYRRVNKRKGKRGVRRGMRKRVLSKGAKVQRQLLKELRTVHITQAPKKLEHEQQTVLPGLSNKAGLACLGVSGGANASDYLGVASRLDLSSTGFDNMITLVSGTAASAYTRTFISNYRQTYTISNSSNAMVYYKIHKVICKDHITPALATFSGAMEDLIGDQTDATLFPNTATVKQINHHANNTSSTVAVKQIHSKIWGGPRFRKHYIHKEVRSGKLEPCGQFNLSISAPVVEYQRRSWATAPSEKPYVSKWYFIEWWTQNMADTTEFLMGTGNADLTCRIITKATITQSTLRDYVAKYVVANQTNIATAAALELAQLGQAEAGMEN